MRHLARQTARSRGRRFKGDHLVIDRSYRGEGYGRETEKGKAAMHEAEKAGLVLDATYTAKTFAAALDLVSAGSSKTILYWHTLSSAPFAPLLSGAPELPSSLGGLLQ